MDGPAYRRAVFASGAGSKARTSGWRARVEHRFPEGYRGGLRVAVRDGSGTQAECWLCRRPLGRRVEWHHPKPKSRGGRDTVPVHPICHRAMHVSFSNVALARLEAEGRHPASEPELQAFLRWIAGKPPDFHAPTRQRR